MAASPPERGKAVEADAWALSQAASSPPSMGTERLLSRKRLRIKASPLCTAGDPKSMHQPP